MLYHVQNKLLFIIAYTEESVIHRPCLLYTHIFEAFASGNSVPETYSWLRDYYLVPVIIVNEFWYEADPVVINRSKIALIIINKAANRYVISCSLISSSLICS